MIEIPSTYIHTCVAWFSQIYVHMYVCTLWFSVDFNQWYELIQLIYWEIEHDFIEIPS